MFFLGKMGVINKIYFLLYISIIIVLINVMDIKVEFYLVSWYGYCGNKYVIDLK